MKLYLADVAELADAQVSEACDGDIVEVQVLSSAPQTVKGRREPVNEGLAFFVILLGNYARRLTFLNWNNLSQEAVGRCFRTESGVWK
jgi:hypothetical protein